MACEEGGGRIFLGKRLGLVNALSPNMYCIHIFKTDGINYTPTSHVFKQTVLMQFRDFISLCSSSKNCEILPHLDIFVNHLIGLKGMTVKIRWKIKHRTICYIMHKLFDFSI